MNGGGGRDAGEHPTYVCLYAAVSHMHGSYMSTHGKAESGEHRGTSIPMHCRRAGCRSIGRGPMSTLRGRA